MDDRALRFSECFSIIPLSNIEKEVNVESVFLQHLFDNVPQLLFEVTEKCNFQCEYCGYGENYLQPDLRPLHSARYMRWSTAKTLIDYYLAIWRMQAPIKRRIVVGFYGGEPLLNIRLIKQIVDYLTINNPGNIDYSWIMTTNGALIRKHIDYLIEHQFSINISIDGDEITNSFRVFKNGKQTYPLVIKNIDYLYENHRDYFKEHISIQSVIHKQASIDVVAFFWERYGIITRIIELSKSNLRNSAFINNIYRDVKEDLNRTFENSPNRFSQMGIQSPVENHILAILKSFTAYCYDSYMDFFEKNRKRIFESGTCLPFFSRLFLTATGYIFPCEKVNFQYPLGIIDHNDIAIDLNQLQNYTLRFSPV